MDDAKAIQAEIDQLVWELGTGHYEPEDRAEVYELIEDLHDELENLNG
jgi:hypothetical protein